VRRALELARLGDAAGVPALAFLLTCANVRLGRLDAKTLAIPSEELAVPRATEQLAGLIATPQQKLKLVRGKQIEIHLDTGELVDATVTSLRSRSDSATRITARARTWSRWTGTTEDILAFVNKATAEIADRAREKPEVSITIGLSANEEDRYFDVPTFENEMLSGETGAPGARLRDIQWIDIAIGPTQNDALKVNAIFSRNLHGVVLALEGTDRTVVTGLREELARMIDARRPRIPALPGPAQMLVFGLAGFAYFTGLSSVNWDFMPDGWIGTMIFALLYLSGFIALIYGLAKGIRSLLPPLTLSHSGQKSYSQQWGLRVGKAVGALGLAAVPFVLEQIFGK